MNKIGSKIVKENNINTDKFLISNDDLISALKTVFDPEIPVDIYELGLIYDVFVNEDNEVKIIFNLDSL